MPIKELQLTDLLMYPLHVAHGSSEYYPMRGEILDCNHQIVITCENVVVAHKLAELLNQMKVGSEEDGIDINLDFILVKNFDG